jgi:dCMP deaminase
MSRPDWDTYWLQMAQLVSTRATCPRARIGCVLVRENRLLSMGYNGAPAGQPHCPDSGEALDEHMALDHCDRSSHAEWNAIRNAVGNVFGAVAYVVGPRSVCPRCRDALRQQGIEDIRHRYGIATLDSLAREIGEWQSATFPQATPISVAEHLRREAEELAGEPSNSEEIADIFHLLVAAANANDYDLVDVVTTKFVVNLGRRWKQPDHLGVVEHVR